MKPIDKYRIKFTELLREAENELGEDLEIEVTSRKPYINPNTAVSISTALTQGKTYVFRLKTID